MGLFKNCIVFLLISVSGAFINQAQFKYNNSPKSFINSNFSSQYNFPKGSSGRLVFSATKRMTEPIKHPLMTFNNEIPDINTFSWCRALMHTCTFVILAHFMKPPPPPPGGLIAIPIDITDRYLMYNNAAFAELRTLFCFVLYYSIF